MIKQNKIKHILIISVIFVFYSFASILYADPVRVGPVKVELVSEFESIQAGIPFEVGLYVIPDQGWYVYWKNPGDAGLPPELNWELPENFKAGKIDYAAPERIKTGPLASYGYNGEVLYPVTISPSENIENGDSIRISLKAGWLVCKLECLPGSAYLELVLPVTSNSEQSYSEHYNIFQETRENTPRKLPFRWQASSYFDSSYIYLDFKAGKNFFPDSEIEFFASEKAVIEHAADQVLSKSGESYQLKLKRSGYSQSDPDSLKGVLAVYDENTNFYDISVKIEDTQAKRVGYAQSGLSGILTALMFAFIGGLILNLMPCVLPVLSLKVLGLVQQADKSRFDALKHGLLFTIGVLVSFWLIVGLMFILQAGGEQLGWGFQLQSPVFVMILSGFLFLFALSLFGVYEINFLSVSAGNLSQKHSSGLAGAFISGVTATFVATPCTAPFMGAALGYSLAQPILISFMIYTFLGLGMAAPYLVLSIFPKLLKFVPKPGNWMITLRQILGFLLAATVIWLSWVLASQAGAFAVVILMGVLLLISVAAWIYGRWNKVSSSDTSRWISRIAALIIIVISFGVGISGISTFSVSSSEQIMNSKGRIDWQKYSTERLNTLLSGGNSVFIDFTAAWCLSCQVNEIVAFSSDRVQKRFQELDIIALKADWTHRSDEITQALASYGRNSVPLYVLYTAGNDRDPHILPEILTPQIVLNALDKIEMRTVSYKQTDSKGM